MLILLIIPIMCWREYIFPFYDFATHTQPVVFVNETELEPDLNFYQRMKKISIAHSIFWVPTTALIVATPTIVTPFAPIPIVITLYHTYTYYKSKHIYEKIDFIINHNPQVDNNRFAHALRNLDLIAFLPRWLFSPIAFILCIWGFTIVYLMFLKKRSIKFLVVCVIIMFYVYAVLHEMKVVKDIDIIKKGNNFRELKWKCHVRRMTFWEKVKKNWFSLTGIQSDEAGYAISKECQELEEEMQRPTSNFITILISPFTDTSITLLQTILSSVRWYDKILLILFGIGLLLMKTVVLDKKFIGDIEEEGEEEFPIKKEKAV